MVSIYLLVFVMVGSSRGGESINDIRDPRGPQRPVGASNLCYRRDGAVNRVLYSWLRAPQPISFAYIKQTRNHPRHGAVVFVVGGQNEDTSQGVVKFNARLTRI